MPLCASTMPTISAVSGLRCVRRRCQTKRAVPSAIQTEPATPAAVFHGPLGAWK